MPRRKTWKKATVKRRNAKVSERCEYLTEVLAPLKLQTGALYLTVLRSWPL